jgi:hypothetical protein
MAEVKKEESQGDMTDEKKGRKKEISRIEALLL